MLIIKQLALYIPIRGVGSSKILLAKVCISVKLSYVCPVERPTGHHHSTKFFEISTETRTQSRRQEQSAVGRKVPSDDRRTDVGESASPISETHLVNLVRFSEQATAACCRAFRSGVAGQVRIVERCKRKRSASKPTQVD